jgi:hypothetical protein
MNLQKKIFYQNIIQLFNVHLEFTQLIISAVIKNSFEYFKCIQHTLGRD